MKFSSTLILIADKGAIARSTLFISFDTYQAIEFAYSRADCRIAYKRGLLAIPATITDFY